MTANFISTYQHLHSYLSHVISGVGRRPCELEWQPTLTEESEECKIICLIFQGQCRRENRRDKFSRCRNRSMNSPHTGAADCEHTISSAQRSRFKISSSSWPLFSLRDIRDTFQNLTCTGPVRSVCSFVILVATIAAETVRYSEPNN